MKNKFDSQFNIYQEWINLSDKSFENIQYDNRKVETIPYFKPYTGLWFSLPTNNKYISEWGEFLKDAGDFKGFVDENNQTNIITAKLKNESYVIELDSWKDTILEVLNTTSVDSSNQEKRAILLDKIKQKTGNKDINYLIYDIKEEEFNQIKQLYYEQSGDTIKKEKNARKFHIVEECFVSDIGFSKLFNNFPEFKNTVLGKIQLLKVIYEKGQEIKYNDIEKCLDSDIIYDLEQYKIEKEFNDESITEDELLKYVIERIEKQYNFQDVEKLYEYETVINETNNIYEYKKIRDEKLKYLPKTNQEIEWITEYFSGSINKKYIQGYDMPSLAIFDTNCIDILQEKRENIFNEIEEKTKQNTEENIREELKLCVDNEYYLDKPLISKEENIDKDDLNI